MIRYYVLLVISELTLLFVGLPLYEIYPKFISYTSGFFWVITPVIAWYMNKYMKEKSIQHIPKCNFKFVAITFICAVVNTLYAAFMYSDFSIIIIGVVIYVIAQLIPIIATILLFRILHRKTHYAVTTNKTIKIKINSITIQPVVALCFIIITVILYCYLLLRLFNDYWAIENLVFAAIPTIGLAHGLYHSSKWETAVISVWYSVISLVTNYVFLIVYSATTYHIMINCKYADGYDTRYNVFLDNSNDIIWLVPIIQTLIVCVPVLIAMFVKGFSTKSNTVNGYNT